MANIGTFTAEKDGFTGTLRTLTLNVKVSSWFPTTRATPRTPPTSTCKRLATKSAQRGRRPARPGGNTLSVSIDDPSFPATVYARLIENEDGTARPDLVAQQAEGGLTAAYRVPPTAAGAMLLIAAPHAQDFCCCRVLDTPVTAGPACALWLAIRVNERCGVSAL